MNLNLLVPSLLMSLAALAAQDTTASTRPQSDEIDKLVDELNQPGPEARAKRYLAIERLLGCKEVRAHAALIAHLRDGGEAEAVVRALVLKVQNPTDPVFGWQTSAAGRAHVLRLYTDFAVTLLASSVASGSGTGSEPSDAKEAAKAGRALAILLVLRPAERLELFKLAFAQSDEPKAARALAVAAECRDLGLAPEILKAGRERAALATAARDALRRLCFAPGLVSLADAEALLATLEGKTYLDLAESAGRAALTSRAGDSVRRDLLTTKKALLEVALAAHSVDWALIQRHVIGEASNGDSSELLAHLRTILQRLDAPPGATTLRAPFVQALLQRFDSAPTAVQPLLLECAAFLVSAEDGQLADQIASRLIQALESDAPRLREAALVGLGRHPSEKSRARIVMTLRDAMTQRDATIAAAALRTLASKGYAAPQEPPESVVWLAALQEALRSPVLDAKTRSQALQALGQRDAEGKGSKVAFQALGELGADAGLEPWLRQQALALFAALARSGSETELVADRLLLVLADSEAQVRAQAAELLGKLPLDTWRPEILGCLRHRLVVEPDRDVLAALLVCAKQRTNQLGDPEPILSLLRLALEDLGTGATSRPEDPLTGERKAAIANTLTTVAATQGVPALLWARAAQVLLQIGDRDRARILLDRQLQGLAAQDLAADMRTLIAKLVVEVALKKPKDIAWRALGNEPVQVVQAIETLEALQQDVQTPALVLLRLETLSAAGRAAEAAALLRRTWLVGASGSAGPAGPASRQGTLPKRLSGESAAAAAAIAEALLGSGDPQGALALCSDLLPALAGTPSAQDLAVTRLAASMAHEPAKRAEARAELASLLRTLQAEGGRKDLQTKIAALIGKS